METQNTEATVHLLETTAEKALQLGSAAVEKLNNGVGWAAVHRSLGSDEVPKVIGAELNADIDRDLLARMRDLTRKRMTLQPAITDEEVADYQALAENFENFRQRPRQGTRESSPRGSVAWPVATLAILVFLTAMLILGIAISV